MVASRPSLPRNNRPPPGGRPSSGATVPLSYTCHHFNCRKAFSTIQQMIPHYRLHLRTRPYRCVKCEFSSAHQGKAVTHIRTAHMDLPATVEEERELGIVDRRDPKVLLQIDTEQLNMEEQLIQCASRLPHEDELHSESEPADNSEPEVMDSVTQARRQYACRFAACGSVCSSIPSLYEHTKSHTGYRPYRCSILENSRLCGAEFSSKDKARAHIRTVHWALPASEREQRARGIVDEQNADAFIHFNGHIFELERQFIIQQMAINLWVGSEGGAEEELENEESDREAGNAQSESESESESEAESETESVAESAAESAPFLPRQASGARPYVCPEAKCGSAFVESTSLRQHMRIHWKMAPFSCALCGHASTTKSNSLKHIKSQHRERIASEGDRQPVDYLRIDREMLSRERVRFEPILKRIQARRRKEAGEEPEGVRRSWRPYPCPGEQCGKAFPEAKELREHMRLHWKMRPYACAICSRTSTLKGNLLAHIRWHIEKGDVPGGKSADRRPADYLRIDAEQLRQEVELFSSVLKDIEEKREKKEDSEVLSEEVTVEAEERDADYRPALRSVRRWVCPEVDCAKEHPSASHLLTHMRTHWGTRPYGCALCQLKVTSQKSNALVHIRGHFWVRTQWPAISEDSRPEDFLTVDQSLLKREIRLFKESLQRGDGKGGEREEAEGEGSQGATAMGDRQAPERLEDGEESETETEEEDVSESESEAPLFQSSNRAYLFPCSIASCGRVFASSTRLRFHLRLHWSILPYGCALCSYTSAEQGNLLKHIRAHLLKQEKGVTYEAANCQVADHLTVDREQLAREAQLWPPILRDIQERHRKDRERRETRPLASALMGREAKEDKETHGDEDIETETDDEEAETTLSSFSGLQLDDSESDFSITDLAYSSSDDSGESSSDYSSDSSGDETPKLYACPAEGCPCVYRRAGELTVHQRCHRDRQPYRCTFEDCNAMFIDQRRALRHVRLVHFGLPPTQSQQRRVGIEDTRNVNEFVAFDVEQLENEDREASFEPKVCPVDQGPINPFKCLWPGCLLSATQKSHVLQHICQRHLLNSGLANPKLKAQRFIREGPRHACTYASVHFRRQALCLWTGFSNSVARKRHEREHFHLAAFHCTGRRENGRPCGYKRNKWGKVFRHARESHLKIERQVSPGEVTNEDASPRGSQFIKVVESLLDYDRL